MNRGKSNFLRQQSHVVFEFCLELQILSFFQLKEAGALEMQGKHVRHLYLKATRA